MNTFSCTYFQTITGLCCRPPPSQPQFSGHHNSRAIPVTVNVFDVVSNPLECQLRDVYDTGLGFTHIYRSRLSTWLLEVNQSSALISIFWRKIRLGQQTKHHCYAQEDVLNSLALPPKMVKSPQQGGRTAEARVLFDHWKLPCRLGRSTLFHTHQVLKWLAGSICTWFTDCTEKGDSWWGCWDTCYPERRRFQKPPFCVPSLTSCWGADISSR